MALATAKFTFHGCSKCDAIFFGGLAQCGVTSAAGGDSDDSAQVSSSTDDAPHLCPACEAAPPGATLCGRHGSDAIFFKCLYCCSVATHICRAGRNVYCDPCHDLSVENAKRNGTVLDWRPILARDEHRQCSGRDASTCALRVNHAAHGIKFALGCMGCATDVAVAGLPARIPVADLLSSSSVKHVGGGALSMPRVIPHVQPLRVQHMNVDAATSASADADLARAIAASLTDTQPPDAGMLRAIQESLAASSEENRDIALAITASLVLDGGGAGRGSWSCSAAAEYGGASMCGAAAQRDTDDDALFAEAIALSLSVAEGSTACAPFFPDAPYLSPMFDAPDEWGLVKDVTILSATATQVMCAEGRFPGERVIVRATLIGGTPFDIELAAWRPAPEAAHACRVLSIAPFSARESSHSVDICSVPFEHAVAKLAELFAHLACERDESSRLLALSQRLEAAALITHAVPVLNMSRVERPDVGQTLGEAQSLLRALKESHVLNADLSLRDAILSALVAADERVRHHCLVCARILPPNDVSLYPHTCGRDACIRAELDELHHMDVFSALSSTPPDVVRVLLSSAIAASGATARRDALFAELPAIYRLPNADNCADASCDSACALRHKGATCTLCGNNWGTHSDHNCPPTFVNRGAFSLSSARSTDEVQWELLMRALKELSSLGPAALHAAGNLRSLRSALASASTGDFNHTFILTHPDPLAELSTAHESMDLTRTVLPQHCETTSAKPRAAPRLGPTDPDRLLRTLWWVLRSARCDFEEISIPQLRFDIMNSNFDFDAHAGQRIQREAALPTHWTPSNTSVYALSQHGALQSPRVFDESGAAAAPVRLLFHGTMIENVTSILRTGLQVLSNTSHQAHGVALGSGIYLARSAMTAHSYTMQRRPTAPPPHGDTADRLGVIFAAEVSDGPHVVEKSHGIFVCTDATKVRLKYMIVLKR